MWGPPDSYPPPITPQPRRRRSGAGSVVVILAIVAVILIVVGLFVAWRYLPFVGQVQDLRATAALLADDMRDMGLEDLEGDAPDVIRGHLATLEAQLVPFRDLLSGDPLVGLARALPVVGEQVRGADSIVGAADDLVAAGDLGMILADRFRALRARTAADPESSLMAGLVELMATSNTEIDQLDALVTSARDQLAQVPDSAMGQMLTARDLMRDPLDRYAPLLADYQRLDDVLPAMLGWGGEKRYLVMAQNPAELRPTGGYAGTYGIVSFKDGQLVERRFFNVNVLDTQPDLPFVEAPQELRSFLLGEEQSWLLADANWSPDYPTSAQKARELYELETGDADIDGVIAITTFALDRILEVVGPVEVPEFGVTVAPGDVTMAILAVTRLDADSDEYTRKAVLDVLAQIVLERLLSLPTDQWVPLFGRLEGIANERLLLAWFADPDAQAIVRGTRLAGEVRQDSGDYLHIVESNMAPTSKYNLVVRRASQLGVQLATDGSASSTLRMDWQNDAGKEGEPYASLRSFSNSADGLYGAYVRTLVPDGSELLSATGRAIDRIQGVESVQAEAGRTVFGNFLLMPPGAATLTYFWTRDGVAVEEEPGSWEYRLVVQKQPGAAPESVTVRVELPDGANVTTASDGAIIDGDRVMFEIELITDTELVVRYVLPPEPDVP